MSEHETKLIDELRSPVSMSQFLSHAEMFAYLHHLKDQAADEIDQLTAQLAEATKDRDYWKVEAEGERAKVEFRDKRMFNFHADEGELLFEIPRHIAVSIEPDGVGYTIFDPKADCWKAGRYEIAKDIGGAGSEIVAAIRALKGKT